MYKGYKQAKAIYIIFHPWYLKQYNNRWFLFGYNEKLKTISNLALDRIIEFKETKAKYHKNNEINFEEYFEDIVGVTFRSKAPIEKILIKITNEAWPYIESKPIHGSQKIKNKTATDIIIELNVKVNYELIAILFSYMDTIEVIESEDLRNRFKIISKAFSEKYI